MNAISVAIYVCVIATQLFQICRALNRIAIALEKLTDRKSRVNVEVAY